MFSIRYANLVIIVYELQHVKIQRVVAKAINIHKNNRKFRFSATKLLVVPDILLFTVRQHIFSAIFN